MRDAVCVVGEGSRGWGKALLKARGTGAGPGHWRAGPEVFLISLLPTPAASCDFQETSPAREYATFCSQISTQDQGCVVWVLRVRPAMRGVNKYGNLDLL